MAAASTESQTSPDGPQSPAHSQSSASGGGAGEEAGREELPGELGAREDEDEEDDESSRSSGVGEEGSSERSDSPAGSSLGGRSDSPAGSSLGGQENPSQVGSSTASSTGSSSGGDDGYCSGRTSLEVSEGEPLSRMDSEDRESSDVDCAGLRSGGNWDGLEESELHSLVQPFIVNNNDGLISISSTLMDVDSTISSGRSTPAMMNGQGLITAASNKSLSYNCCWDQCQTCFSSSPDLADHIRSIHVDGQRGGVFVCFWKGCKVYNTPSTSQSWLQRHMLTHSGDKPFKCVVGGCNASFASQGGLARHVPTHFSQQNSSKMSNHPKSKEESPSKAGLNRKRKLKNRRKRTLPAALGTSPYSPTTVQLKARPHDFFDAQTLDAIRHRAICFNLSAQIESLGNGHSVVFHSTVIAKRKEESGKIKLLLHWTPEDILPDVWVNESDRHQLKTKVVHLSKLPKDTALLLDPNIYRNSSKRITQSGTMSDPFS